MSENGDVILVVDDEEEIRVLIRKTLERAGYGVVEAGDGLTALRALYEQRPQLVILDLVMPELDGLEVLDRIREISELPVLILSARALEWERATGLRRGADDYLVKPFAFAELVARVRTLARRGRLADTTALVEGDLKLDRATRRVTRAGRPVDLTVREFELLEHLLRSRRQVVSREALARDVWKETARTSTLDNVIDVHIARLRRKVDAERPVKLIHTIRGVGFMISEVEP